MSISNGIINHNPVEHKSSATSWSLTPVFSALIYKKKKLNNYATLSLSVSEPEEISKIQQEMQNSFIPSLSTILVRRLRDSAKRSHASAGYFDWCVGRARKLSRWNEWEDSHITILPCMEMFTLSSLIFTLNRKLGGFSNVRGVAALKKYWAMM